MRSAPTIATGSDCCALPLLLIALSLLPHSRVFPLACTVRLLCACVLCSE